MKWKKDIQNYRTVHLWITKHLSAILMKGNLVNLFRQVIVNSLNIDNSCKTLTLLLSFLLSSSSTCY